MAASRSDLWIVWAALLAAVALCLAAPRWLPPPALPWYTAQANVVRFVLALIALAAAVGTFAMRESLVMRGIRAGALDPTTPQGYARVRTTLVLLWGLCALIASFGVVLALGSGDALLGAPFPLAAAALLVIHRPHARWFEKPRAA